MATEVEWIRSEAGFQALENEWDALSTGSPFDLHCWYRVWWEAFGSGAELAICALRHDAELVGVFPLLRRGRRLRAMANVHSPTFRPLARDAAALEELVTAAARGGGLELCALPAEGGFVDLLGAGARASSLIPLIEPSYCSPCVDTSGDFDAWRAVSKKRWGAPIERFRRKMARDHQAEFAIVEVPGDLDAELADGFQLEAAGWKGERGTAILSAPETLSFYTAVAKSFAGRGELRFGRIVLDGVTASFDYTILHGERLYLLKTAFNEDFRKLAPGLVMRLSTIERCFEMGLSSHELLGGESEWKSKFATGGRKHLLFEAYPLRPSGLFRYGYRRALRPGLKKIYRTLRPMTDPRAAMSRSSRRGGDGGAQAPG